MAVVEFLYETLCVFTMSDNALLVGLLSSLGNGGREYTAFPVCQMYVLIYKYNGLCKRDGCLVIG